MSTEIAKREYTPGRIVPIGNVGVIKNMPVVKEGKFHLPVIGNIKIGKKVVNKNGNEYPTSLDYFIATNTRYGYQFKETYGEKPDKLEILFPVDDRQEYCYESYQIRDYQGKLLAEGNGIEWARQYNYERDAYLYEEITPIDKLLKYYDKSKPVVSAVLTLKFILLKLSGVAGCWKFVTKGGASSIPNIRDTYDYIMKYASTTVNIPFDMIVKKVTSQKPGSKSVYPVVSIVANLSKESLDVLSEFVESGRTIRGVITEEKLLELSSSSPKQLVSSTINSSDNIETAEVVEIDEVELATPEGDAESTTTDADFLDEHLQQHLIELAEKAGIKEEWLGELLAFYGINSLQEFPRARVDNFVAYLKSGKALEKAKELFN